jgi:HEAT repeat protein
VSEKWLLRSAACLGWLLALAAPAHASDPARAHAFDEGIDTPMYHAPELPTFHLVSVFPEGAKPLWLKALARPEADFKCKAAAAITRAARKEVKGLDMMAAPLIEELDRPEQNPAARLAIAEALIALDAKQAAPVLLRQSQAGNSDLRDLVEPALARWDHRPVRAVWLARLGDPATPPRSLLLAIHGLATVREEEAADRLRELALAPHGAGPVRLEAAQALAMLREKGLEKDAAALLTDTSPRGLLNRLVAATLLQRHRGEEAVRLLQQLAKDSEPAVAALAVSRLIVLDPDFVFPALDGLLASPDARLRSFAVDVLFQRPTEKHLRLLGDRLDDTDTEVRRKARRNLIELAEKKEFHDTVIREGERLLATKQWRGLEQAAILLTALNHKAATKRMLELLTFDRPEVFITVAWGLRRLAVPETLPDVRKYIEAECVRLLAGQMLPNRKDVPPILVDHQLSQLNQFLGQQKDAKADALLRLFIPHHGDKQMDESRTAAVWAIGLIHEGKPVPNLATALEARLNDNQAIPPEDLRVRQMSAITLGRMGAKEALPSLRSFFPNHEAAGEPVHDACGWAIQQLTGEVMANPKPTESVQRDWFLTPDQ